MREIVLGGNTWFIESDMWKKLNSSISENNSLQQQIIDAFGELVKSLSAHLEAHNNFEFKLTSGILAAVNNRLNIVGVQMKKLETATSEISKSTEYFQSQIAKINESNMSMSEGVSNMIKAFQLQVKTMNELNAEMSKLLQNLGKSVLSIAPTISSAVESAVKSFSNIVIESYRQKQMEFSARCDDSIKRVDSTSESLRKMREEFTKSLADINNMDSLVKRLERSDAEVESLRSNNKELAGRVDELAEENRVLNESVVKLESDKDGLVKALKELQPEQHEETPSILESKLSDKETKIVNMLKQSKGTMEIASICDVSPGYVSQIKKKHSI